MARVLVKNECELKVDIPSDILYRSLESVYRCAAIPKDVKPHLEKVLIRISKSSLVTVATNGQVLSKYEDKTAVINDAGYSFDWTLSVSDIKSIISSLKSHKKTSIPVQLSSNDKKSIELLHPDFGLKFMLKDPDFPPYDSVIPTSNDDTDLTESNGSIGLANKYILIVCNTFKSICGADVILEYKIRRNLDPIVVTTVMEPELKIIIMPCRV